jgi:hypothetical protein
LQCQNNLVAKKKIEHKLGFKFVFEIFFCKTTFSVKSSLAKEGPSLGSAPKNGAKPKLEPHFFYY